MRENTLEALMTLADVLESVWTLTYIMRSSLAGMSCHSTRKGLKPPSPMDAVDGV